MKITIYLPDELGARVKKAKLNVSAICQEALADRLDGKSIVCANCGQAIERVSKVRGKIHYRHTLTRSTLCQLSASPKRK